MSTLDRGARAILALVALACLAGIAAAHERAEAARESHEYRSSAGDRQGARHAAEARQSRRTHPARAETVRITPRREAPHTREMAGRPLQARRPSDGGFMREGPRSPAPSQASSPARVVRFGNSLSGTVERSIRPGFTSRTFVSGGRVLYTRVYQNHVWHQFGQVFGYETFVPAVRYPAVYYTWALAPWPRPFVYTWGWRAQPWFPMYGVLFTPYPVYTSPDLWMTDYIIAQSMQAAYSAQNAAPAPQVAPQEPPAAPGPDPGLAAPAGQAGDSALAPPAGDAVPASAAPPPAITPQVKAELNAQIKVQLQEQESAAATPATLTTRSTPPALRANHVFFEVVQTLDVPTAHGHCSLSANDYIKRTGGMSSDDWMIPVVVELSRPSDCPEGLVTRIGLNDLNAMENEQEAQVLEAMQAASKKMGPNGPPSGVHPTLIADGSAAPDPGALDALRQAH
jgi:hypothetical protein